MFMVAICSVCGANEVSFYIIATMYAAVKLDEGGTGWQRVQSFFLQDIMMHRGVGSDRTEATFQRLSPPVWSFIFFFTQLVHYCFLLVHNSGSLLCLLWQEWHERDDKRRTKGTRGHHPGRFVGIHDPSHCWNSVLCVLPRANDALTCGCVIGHRRGDRAGASS